MVESGAIMRVAAANANLMGTGKDFVVSEMLLGLNGDLIKCTYGSGKVPTVLSVKDFDDKKKTEFESETKPAVAAQLGKYEQFLLPAGDRFTESGQTLGEIHLFCQLHMLSNGALPEVIQGKLASFYSRMASIPGIKKVLDGQSVMGELAHYLVPLP